MPVQELMGKSYCQQERLFLSSFHAVIIEITFTITSTHPNLTFYLILIPSKVTICNTKKQALSITNKAQVE